ncbi:hypothetical protein OIV83_000143 [Microbotryomycetes sp. JL201]|nr:hypothetical protein OIV83_000143 [Microbotryomycetes sp. JL201]
MSEARRVLRARTHQPNYSAQILPTTYDESSEDTADEWHPNGDRDGKAHTEADASSSSAESSVMSDASLSDDLPGVRRRRRRRSSQGSRMYSTDDDDDDDEGRDTPNNRNVASDWMDPRALPRNGPHRRKRALLALEHGLCVSALRDDVYNQLNIATTLFEWEMLRQERVNEQGARPSLTPPVVAVPPLISSRASTPDPYSDQSRQSNFANLPSAQAMTEMARWPVYSHSLPALQDPVDLQETLSALISASRRKYRSESLQKYSSNRKPKVSSAYRGNGPFAAWRTSVESSGRDQAIVGDQAVVDDTSCEDTDGDEDGAVSSELDDGVSNEIQPPRSRAIQQRLQDLYGALLAALVKEIPLSDMPARNIYEAPSAYRNQSIKVARGIDWTTVVQQARKIEGVPKHVTEALQRRMEGIYGPSVTPADRSEGLAEDAKYPVRRRIASAAPALESMAERPRRIRSRSGANNDLPAAKRARSQPSSHHASRAGTPLQHDVGRLASEDLHSTAPDHSMPELPPLPPFTNDNMRS